MAQYCLEMHVTTKSQTYSTLPSNMFDTLVKLALFGCLVWATAIILPGNALVGVSHCFAWQGYSSLLAIDNCL